MRPPRVEIKVSMTIPVKKNLKIPSGIFPPTICFCNYIREQACYRCPFPFAPQQPYRGSDALILSFTQ